MIYLKLFFEFFKIGMFAVGGGMATIPFLQKLSETSGWYGPELISDMIAISESTPGPIGINMATYVGFNVAGIFGGVIATLGIVFPAVIICTLVSKSLEKFSGNKYVDYIFYGLRPAVTGLIAAAGFSVLAVALLDRGAFTASGAILDLFRFDKIIYCAVVFFAIRKFKKHPVLYIAISAVVGLLLGF